MTARPSRRGYVLLVTLGLLVLSATLLVAVGRAAVRHAADARLAAQAAQRHWAVASARRAVLPYAEQILSTAEAAQNRPVASVRADVRLGATTLSLVVADEQAKANVNELLGRTPPGQIEDRLRAALSGTPAYGHVRLRPAAGGPATPPGLAEAWPAVSGYGQIVDDPTPAAVLPAAAIVTCWGDGGLNLMRAGRPALRLALTPALSGVEIDRLLRARDAVAAVPRNGKLPTPAAAATAVRGLLDAAGVAPADRAKLPLAAASHCHSLLTILNDGRRLWYDQTAVDASDARRPKTASVSW